MIVWLRKTFNTESAIGRFTLVFVVYFLYWLFFWNLPVILSLSETISDAATFSAMPARIISSLFIDTADTFKFIKGAIWGYYYLITSPADFETILIYPYLVAPVFILVPYLVIKKTLVNFSIVKNVIVAILVIAISFLSTYYSIIGSITRNAQF